MWWRWPWRRPARVDGPERAAHRFRSRAVWADLTYPDAVLAQAAQLATQIAGDLAALERVLNEPTAILDLGLRVPPFVMVGRRAGRWEVRHA